jgi:hypothetical protein
VDLLASGITARGLQGGTAHGERSGQAVLLPGLRLEFIVTKGGAGTLHCCGCPMTLTR